MKKLIFIFVLCLSFGMLSAQESVTLKNAGNDALKEKNYAKALENYEKAIAAWGTDSMDYAMVYNTAFSAFQVKDYDKAIKYFEQSIAGNYKPEDAMFNKALVYKIQKKDEEYVKVLNDGIAKYPGNTKFKAELAKTYLIEGNTHYNNGATILKGAVEKVTAKKFKDTNDPAYKAEIEKAKKEFNEAIPPLNKALELTPDDAKAKALKAACEKQAKSL